MSRYVAPTLVLLLLLASVTSSVALAAPSLTFQPSAVAIEGVTPGGEVAWLAVSRRPLETHQRVEIYRQLTTADAAGRAQLALGDTVTLKSIFAAVDLATGDYAVAAPATSSLLERALLAEAFITDASGAAVLLRHDRPRMEALVVRPGSATGSERPSAWAGAVEDGGALDEGEAYDGQVELSPRLLPPLIEDQPAAQTFRPGDVVILINPEALEISALRLGEGPAGQGGER